MNIYSVVVKVLETAQDVSYFFLDRNAKWKLTGRVLIIIPLLFFYFLQVYKANKFFRLFAKISIREYWQLSFYPILFLVLLSNLFHLSSSWGELKPLVPILSYDYKRKSPRVLLHDIIH